jgi:hypothetical protein
MVAGWRAVASASDPYLDTLTSEGLLGHWEKGESSGTSLRRVTYHY